MSEPVFTSLFIDGASCQAQGEKSYGVHNPANPDHIVGYAADASVGDVESAIAAAKNAHPKWAGLDVSERADYIRKIAENLKADEGKVAALAKQFTTEHGKILFESTLEINRFADRFMQVASFASRLAEEEKISGPAFDTIVTRTGRGVTTLIVPWNWPLAILGSKLPQALLAGNAVVVKLSEYASLTPAILLAKVAAMLPAGVMNIITGDGRIIGDTLVGHPDVRQVNFTGSVAIGRHVMMTAAQNITPVTLELGGNDAGIILEDAVLDDAFFQKLYLAVFLTSGQICMALKRLYVHENIYDDVISGLAAHLDKQRIGSGLEQGVGMGPVNNERQYNVVKAMLDEAKAKGQDIHYYGMIDDDELFQKGYFYRPSLVVNADPSLSVVREEQFGPTLPIMPFKDEAEAILMANDSELGLSSSVWSQDTNRAVSVARQLEAGFTNINAHGPTAMDGLSPFGGVKQSGVGRNFGYEGITQFQEAHSISGITGAVFGS